MTKRQCWTVELKHNIYYSQRLKLTVTACSAAIAERRAGQIAKQIAKREELLRGKYLVESLTNSSTVYCF